MEGLNELVGSIWIGRGGGSAAMVMPLWDVRRGNESLETIDTIDRQIDVFDMLFLMFALFRIR